MTNEFGIALYNYGDRICVLPLAENLEHDNIEFDADDPAAAFPVLKEKWEAVNWNYYDRYDVGLIPLFHSKAEHILWKALNPKLPGFDITTEFEYVRCPDDTTPCSEWDVIGFTELMHTPKFYNTPWDTEPNGMKFCSYEAKEGMRGGEYSKDFGYFDCNECGRTICEQNPANGWHSQIHFMDGGFRACSKCFQELTLSRGVDIDKIIDEQTLSGMFFDSDAVAAAGFETVEGWEDVGIGMGHHDTYSIADFFDRLSRDRHLFDDKITIIDYDSMAIGGLGGYVTFYARPAV